MYHVFFIHLPVDAHLGCFHIFLQLFKFMILYIVKILFIFFSL